MAAALLDGHVVQAFWFNPFLFVLGAVLCVLTIFWAIEALGGPAVRPPRSWPRISQKRVYGVVGVFAIAFMVVRNLA